MISTKIAQIVAQPAQADAEIESLHADYEVASPSDLVSAHKAIVTAQKDNAAALQPEQWQKLIGIHQARTKQVATSGEVGVYSGPLARFEAEKYSILKRQTAGVFPGAMPDFAKLAEDVSRIVTRATENAASATPPTTPKAAQFAPLAGRLLGVNTGNDQLSEVISYVDKQDPRALKFDAFDRAGFHVIFGQVKVEQRSLYVSYLKATHGRNVEDLTYVRGEEKMPGRGNSRAIAEALNGAVDCALEAGFSSLACTPGSLDVAELYAKMGFVREDGIAKPEAWKKMKLDLTNPAVVQQMTFVFSASRASITDVPKTVADKMLAKNQPLGPPNRQLEKWNFDQPGIDRASFVLEPDLNTTGTSQGSGV